jgi:glycine/D-amino acid oxidase-like deaminating enzyme
MRFISYWHDTAPPFTTGEAGPVRGEFDVAIIGGGFTGLAAARHLARAGAHVVVLEAEHVGFGASGRNGGHLNNGIAHSFAAARAEFGAERASALYHAYDRAVDVIEEIVAEEGIDCSFRRAGKLKLASKPQHFAAIANNFDAVHRDVDPHTELLSKSDLGREIGSDAFHGAMLSKKSAMMHMGRYVVGLAEAAQRRSATIFEHAPVRSCQRNGMGWQVTTPSGRLSVGHVLLATGAYTPPEFSFQRHRILSVGSFIIATRPLSAIEAATVMPGDRTCVTSLNIGNYFRLSPDRRLIFGGRARFSARSDQQSDAKSGAILRRSLAAIFPTLADVEIDYCWGGLVDITQDRFPRAGVQDGLHYALGYSGHGAQLSTLMGIMMAEKMLGRRVDNPFEGLPWPAIPFYSGKPWFLPFIGAYYGMLDRIR